MTKEQIEKMAQDMIEGIKNKKGRTAEYKKAAIESVIKMKDEAIANLK